MRGNTTISSNQNVGIMLPRPYDPQKRMAIGLGAAISIVGVLVVGLLLAPEVAVWVVSGIGIGIPLLLLIWTRPEFGLLALIFLTSSFVPANTIDIRLPIGGGLDLRDLVLIGLFGLIVIRQLVNKTLNIPWWRVGGPLVLFLIMAVCSAFYAIFFEHVDTNWALSSLRILSCYIVFFITIWGIKRVDQLQVLLIGLFIIADLTTAIIILQQFIGVDNPLLSAMTTTQDWRVYQAEAGLVRVVPAGHVLMHFMWFVALGISAFGQLSTRLKVFLAFQILFIGVGHILTFMRAQWIALFLGFGLLCLVILPKYRSALPKFVIFGISIVLIMAFLWGTIGIVNIYPIPFVSGIVDRFTTILTPDETLETGSLQWRDYENSKALDAILKQPIWGVGLGGRYRELTTFHGEVNGNLTGSIAADRISRFTRYVHNSYLQIAVDMGIPGLLVLLWFCLSFLSNGWKFYKKMPDTELKGLILGVLVGFIGLMEWAFFHAHLIKAESAPVIALMIGIVGVIVTSQIGAVKPAPQG